MAIETKQDRSLFRAVTEGTALWLGDHIPTFYIADHKNIDRFLIKAKQIHPSEEAAWHALQQKDEETFGRVIYATSPRDYLDSILEIATNLPTPDQNNNVLVRRPGGINVDRFEDDLAQASKLSEQTCLVVRGHGSVAFSSGQLFSRHFQESYHDPLMYSDNLVRGQNIVPELLKMKPKDIKVEDYQDEHDLEKRSYEIGRQLAALITQKVTPSFQRGVTVPNSAHFGSLDSSQCGAYGESLPNVLEAFVVYANKVAQTENPNIIPAVELMEQVIISVDARQLKGNGNLAVGFYTPEAFKQNLERAGFTQSKEILCVDERTPHADAGHSLKLVAARSGEYMELSDAFSYNSTLGIIPNWNRRTEYNRMNRRVFGDHHVKLMLLGDSENQQDRDLAVTLEASTQALCDVCAPIGRMRIQGWTDHPSNYERMVNAPATLSFLAPAQEIVDNERNLVGLYHTVGGGLTREKGIAAWKGTHFHTLGGETGLVIGSDGYLSETTLVRPPHNEKGTTRPVLLVTSRILEASGGDEALLARLDAKGNSYGPIAEIDPENEDYRWIKEPNDEQFPVKGTNSFFPLKTKYSTTQENPDGTTTRFMEGDELAIPTRLQIHDLANTNVELSDFESNH